MKKNKWFMLSSLALAFSLTGPLSATSQTYLTQEEYNDIVFNNYSEERGIVVENNPELGYLTYKNVRGDEVTVQYYTNQLEVEKQPYYEIEDKIGYLDKLFPYFSYDMRDTEVQNIKAGDCIFVRKTNDNVLTYIGVYNDYLMRYGKVIAFHYNTGNDLSIELEDENGKIYYYDVPNDTPVTKGSQSVNLSQIKEGDWAKVLVCQKPMGAGIIEETLMEIVLDNNTRTISNLYRGQLASIDTYQKLINIKNAQALEKTTWGPYQNLKRFSVDTTGTVAYQNGRQLTIDYMNRYLKNADGYVYIATEDYKGKETAIKLNFQDTYQNTLPATRVISANDTSVKLLSGETLTINGDSIIVRDNRLVGANSIMVGDTLQAVVAGNSQIAVGRISTEPISQGELGIYRGRIKRIDKREEFQVETFSLLTGHLWYYHPTPQTFTLDNRTEFYNEDGLIEDGLETFVDYGAESSMNEVFTVVADGERAYAVLDMPYSTQAVRGEIYNTDEDDLILVKDVYYYNEEQRNWQMYSQKNTGATLNILGNTLIIKNGKVVSKEALEPGDIIRSMVDANLKTAEGTVTAQIICVEN